MKKRLQAIAFALIACALLGTAAQASVKSKNVTFLVDLTVGDTLVKQGSYQVSFDDQAKELRILRGSKVVARATASLGEIETVGNYKPTYTTLKADKDTALLLTVDVGGKYAIVTSDRIAAARAAASSGQ